MTHSRAESFCVNYCSSHLASIHSDEQFKRTIEIVSHGLDIANPALFDTAAYTSDSNPGESVVVGDVWLGLYRSDLDGDILDLSWTDNSAFDFGNWNHCQH